MLRHALFIHSHLQVFSPCLQQGVGTNANSFGYRSSASFRDGTINLHGVAVMSCLSGGADSRGAGPPSAVNGPPGLQPVRYVVTLQATAQH